MARKKQPEPDPTYYEFQDRQGRTMHLRGDLSLLDLIHMGYTDIRLVLTEDPLKPNEWRATGETI